MTANRVRYINGTSALKPVCSRYRNENERIIDYSRAAKAYRRNGSYSCDTGHAKHLQRKEVLRDALSDAVDDSATVRDFRSGNLSGTPINKADSWKMSCFAAAYTVMALAAIIGVAV